MPALKITRIKVRCESSGWISRYHPGQARRWVVYDDLRQGRYLPWDHQHDERAAERFMRNHMDLNVVEEEVRFP